MDDQRICRGIRVFFATERRPAHPIQIYEALCYFALSSSDVDVLEKERRRAPVAHYRCVLLIGTFLPSFFIEYVKNVQVQSEYENDCPIRHETLVRCSAYRSILIGIILVILSIDPNPEST